MENQLKPDEAESRATSPSEGPQAAPQPDGQLPPEEEARFQALEHRLLEQEHRTFSIWLNFFQSFRRGHEGQRWPAFKAVLYSLMPGRVTTIVLWGTLIGVITILLMHQNNLLLARQNRYFQEQIYLQAIQTGSARWWILRKNL